MKFGELADQYLDWLGRRRAAGTIRAARSRLDRWTLPRIGSREASEVTALDVEEAVECPSWSEATRAKCVFLIRAIYRYGQQRGIVQQDPTQQLTCPARLTPRDPVGADEFRRIQEAARQDPEMRDLVEFCYQTGCRPQEARCVRIRHWQGRQRRFVIPGPEAPKGTLPRVIYCNEAAAQIVAGRLDRDYLFLDHGDVPFTGRRLSRRFSRIARRAGVDACLYQLRHRWATDLLVSGVDPITVATLAGHRDPTMLARVYSHVHEDTRHLHQALSRRGQQSGDYPDDGSGSG